VHQDLTPLSSDQRYPITLAAEQVTKAGQLVWLVLPARLGVITTVIKLQARSCYCRL